MAQDKYDKRVFINCPFDAQYKPLFEAIVFAVYACGFRPKCGLEIDDASEVRIEKIFKIIAECKYPFGIMEDYVTSAKAKRGMRSYETLFGTTASDWLHTSLYAHHPGARRE